MPNTTITTKFTKFRDHKHSIRYTASSSVNQDNQPVDNPVRDIYVDRSFANGKTTLEVTFK